MKTKVKSKIVIIIVTLLILLNFKNVMSQNLFSPSFGYKTYAPTIDKSLGTFNGIELEATLLEKNYKNYYDEWYSKIPYYRLYCSINQLNSTDNQNHFFSYSTGIQISFENKIKRYYFIPYYGIEFGKMNIKGYAKGMHYSPIAGIILVKLKTVSLNIKGGYNYPIFAEEYAGYFAQINLEFNLHRDIFDD